MDEGLQRAGVEHAERPLAADQAGRARRLARAGGQDDPPRRQPARAGFGRELEPAVRAERHDGGAVRSSAPAASAAATSRRA